MVDRRMSPCRESGCEDRRFGKSSLCFEHWRNRKLRKTRKAWFVRASSGNRMDVVSNAEGRRVESLTKDIKKEAIDAYGGKCVRCGETNYSRLQLDHVEDNGHTHRLIISKGRAGLDFYRALRKKGYPNKEPYQMEVICFDCHVTTTTERRYSQRRTHVSSK